MIVKKLRQKKRWSQEQLASMAGLSLRTIQRVEAGKPASNETLKSLAAVFEIDISELTRRVAVIDKKSEVWQSVPLWVSMGLLGYRERKQAVLSVVMLVVCGMAFYLYGGWGKPVGLSALAWLSLYLLATGWFVAAIHWVDKNKMW